MAPEQQQQSLYDILPVVPEDAESQVICSDLAHHDSPIRAKLYPKDKKHLTSSDELQSWRITTVRADIVKSLGGDGSIMLKAVLKDDSETIIGYSVWLPPGHWSKGKGPASIGLTPENPPACLDVEYYRDFMKQLEVNREAVWGDNCEFWTLIGLGVHPQHQRKGIAGLLLNPILDRADKAGLPVYLEATPEGARAYPKFGFVECGKFPCGDSDILLMIRQPKPHT